MLFLMVFPCRPGQTFFNGVPQNPRFDRLQDLRIETVQPKLILGFVGNISGLN